jgi:outer membrane protein assembly factor BamB
LVGLDAKNGKELWRTDLLSPPVDFGEPNLGNGRVYVPTADRLFVFQSAADPTCIEQYDLHGLIRGSRLFDNDILYLVVDDTLIAVNTRKVPQAR